MKRFVNFRPLLLIFIVFVGAVYSITKFFVGDIVPLIVFLSILFLLSVLLVISFFKKDFLCKILGCFGIKSFKIFCAIVLISSIVAFAVSGVSFAYNYNRPFEKGNYEITGKAKEIIETEDGVHILIGNLTISGSKCNFNIRANVKSVEFKVGDNLSFTAKLSPISLRTDNGINTSIIKSNIRYYCDIDISTLQVKSGNPFLLDGIKDRTKTILQNNMTAENAGFSYAVLCGDKSLLSDEYYNMYKNAGLSHILAVSGLHVGFLVALVMFILKLFKLKNKHKFFVVASILFVYNMLCNFSPSVFRASVMSLCLLLGFVLGERNDALSNLSLAGIIVLLFQPLYLFDVGFVLSFASVFGILFFAKPIQKLFDKIKFPKFLSSSISITISSTIGTIPFVCKYFGEFAPVTIISNLIALPLFSLMFVILLLGVAINLVVSLPFMITFAQFFVNIVSSLSLVFASFGSFKTMGFGVVSLIMYYLIMFFISPYFMLSVKSKLVCFLSLFICLSVTLTNYNYRIKILYNTVTVTKGTSNSLLFTNKSGKTILSNVDGSYYRYKTTKSMLNSRGVKKIDYLLLFNYTDNAQQYVAEIAKNYSTQKIYVFGEYENSTIIGLINGVYSSHIVEFVSGTSLVFPDCDFFVECYTNDKTKAVKYKNGSTTIMQILSLLNKSEIRNDEFFTTADVDYLLANTFYERYFEILAKVYVCRRSSATEFANLDIEYIEPYNLWTLNEKYDTINA